MQAPALLHCEPDLLIKIVRDVFNEDFQKMVIAGDDAQRDDRGLPRAPSRPTCSSASRRYEGDRDSFDEYRISEQIEKALDRKVWLPSGGSLVIDRTEAMTVVDVNTGKFVGSGGNLEETVTKNNLEAAEEIVRQLRLRDIGGIIVVDFIDMVLESNRDLVLRRLVECLSPRPHQAPGRRGHLARPRADDPQEARPRPARVVQRDLRGLRRPRHHRAPRARLQAPPRRSRSSAAVAVAAVAAGGGGNQAAGGRRRRSPKAHTGTHAITEDVKHALAQIAASTIPHTEHEPAEADAAEPAGRDGRSRRRGIRPAGDGRAAAASEPKGTAPQLDAVAVAAVVTAA